jgi:hypothetical protein
MHPGQMKRLLRHGVSLLAPAGTRRRRLLQRGMAWLSEDRIAPVDVFETYALNRLLKKCHTAPLDGSQSDAAASELGAARFALALLWKEPEIRRRFPAAIFQGSTGAYCRWLCGPGAAHFRLSPQAVEHIQAAFARRMGERVRFIYDCEGLRARFPLALLPAAQRPFLKWLLTEGRAQHGLRDEEIYWFLFECATDPHQGLSATYLRTPAWQQRFPLALTVFGQDEFLSWFGSHYRIRADWLCKIDLSETLHPVDQLRVYHSVTTAAQAVAPRAFAAREDTDRLVNWLRQHEQQTRRLGASWWAKLRRGLEEGLADRPGINVVACFCHPSGIQEAAFSAVEALQGVGFRASCRDVPLNWPTSLPERSDYLGMELFPRTVLMVAGIPDLSVLYSNCGLGARPRVGRIAIAYWELETVVPPAWARDALGLEEVWAPTRFIAQALRKSLPVPVVDMLPGLRPPEPADLRPEHFGLAADRYLFLFMFAMCSTMERKNPLGLIRAFREAFDRNDRVALAIKVARGECNPTGLAQLKKESDAAGVTLINRTTSRAETWALMNACDCYVSLHRSEGFGLTMAEAMLMGKPVIATGYSGNLDFMTPDTSLLVDYERVPIASDLPPYPRGAIWAEPSVDQAADWMRWVYQHPHEARALGQRARRHASQLLSLEAAGRRMHQRLHALELKGQRCASVQA